LKRSQFFKWYLENSRTQNIAPFNSFVSKITTTNKDNCVSLIDTKQFTGYAVTRGIPESYDILYFADTVGMRAFIISILSWLFIASTGFAQPGQYSLRNYKAVDGLPQSQVNIMLEDNNGYLWIGTHGGGLARFDGNQFKIYTTLDGLQSNIITHLKLDSKQNLWIVHPRGISKFDGSTFTKFQQPGNPANAKRIKRMFEYNDSLFITSGMGQIGKIYNDSVYYWCKPVTKNKKHTLYYVHKMPTCEVLLSMSDSSFIIRGNEGDYQLSHKGVFGFLKNVFNYKNEVWITTDRGYFSLDQNKKEFVPRNLDIKNHIIMFDSVANVFWTRNENNLLKESFIGSKHEVDTVLHDTEVNQVFLDDEGNTWFATNGMGLYKYFIQDFDRCSSDNLRAVMAIYKDHEGATWLGSQTKGLWKIHKGKISTYLNKDEPYRNAINTITQTKDGTVWIGSMNGLGKYDRGSDTFHWLTREDGLSSSSIINLQPDDSGGLWIGTTNGGLNYYDGQKFKSYSMKNGLTSNFVMAMKYSPYHNKLFIGNEFGLNIFSQGKATNVSVSGMENATVLTIQTYRDSLLLVGTGGSGILVFNPKTMSKRLLTTRDGLVSDFIYFIAPDSADVFWVGTEKGITRVRLNDSFDIAENLHYGYDNGLTGVESNQNAFYINGDEKYFGLIDGLYQFNDVEKHNKKSFDLHFTDIQLLFDQFDLHDYADSVYGSYNLPFIPNLPPDKNHITFHFNRVDKRYPKSVRFQYFLENFDKGWSPTSPVSEVTYSNLPPGKYIFHVKSTDKQGSWSTSEITYRFIIQAPFYQTASFIIGMIVFLIGLIILILYLRIKSRANRVIATERIRVREQELLRKEISRDFHDEMGNQLTRIINYVSLLKLNGTNGHSKENGSSHHDLYTKVEDSAKYLYSGTRDFIWAIDPVNDELSKLFIHIRDFGDKLFEEKDINFRAYNEIKDGIKLPYGFSREANLIFKEAMTNAFKYSKANNVTFRLERAEHGSFQLTLEDDGVGFYTGDIDKLNGLKNIRERADRIKSVVRITSIKNQGTKIVLVFTLTKTLKYGLAV